MCLVPLGDAFCSASQTSVVSLGRRIRSVLRDSPMRGKHLLFHFFCGLVSTAGNGPLGWVSL